MKTFYSKVLFSLAIATCLCGGGVPLHASEPLRISIEQSNGDNTPAYIVKATDTDIQWKYTPESGGVNTTKLTDIKSIEFDDPEEWPEAQFAFDSGDFAQAEEGFGAIAEKYQDIMPLAGNPAAKAKFLQIESMRNQANFNKIGLFLEPELYETLKKALHEQFLPQLAINNGWAAAVTGKWDVVNQLVAEHIMPVEEGSARRPDFKKELPSSQVVQLAYQRALAEEAADNKAAALDDYYRAMTLGYGGNRALTSQAMLRCMAILKEDPELEEKKVSLKEIHSLAMLFARGVGQEALPSQYMDYNKPVPEDDAPAAAPAEGDAPAEGAPAEGDAPAEGAPASGEAAPAEPAAAEGEGEAKAE